MKVRARNSYGLVHPRLGTMVVVNPGDRDRDSDDPLVVEYPWAFEAIETASAAPGEKRVTRKRTAKKPAEKDDSGDAA
jgi:hypothetical protein